MVERKPVEVTNLSRYGHSVIDWQPIRDRLALGELGPKNSFFLGTTRSDGRPHSAGVGPVWFDGDLYFTSGPATRKSRNLLVNPSCTLSAGLDGFDLVLEGTATRVTDPSILEAVASLYRKDGWPATVDGEGFTASFSAPSAGPPPWDLYCFTFKTGFALRTEGEEGATRWRF